MKAVQLLQNVVSLRTQQVREHQWFFSVFVFHFWDQCRSACRVLGSFCCTAVRGISLGLFSPGTPSISPGWAPSALHGKKASLTLSATGTLGAHSEVHGPEIAGFAEEVHLRPEPRGREAPEVSAL